MTVFRRTDLYDASSQIGRPAGRSCPRGFPARLTEGERLDVVAAAGVCVIARLLGNRLHGAGRRASGLLPYYCPESPAEVVVAPLSKLLFWNRHRHWRIAARTAGALASYISTNDIVAVVAASKHGR